MMEIIALNNGVDEVRDMTMEIETRVCKSCKQEYEPKYYDVLNCHILIGQGFCPTCAQNVYEEEVAKEEAARLAEIASIRHRRRESCGIPPKFMNEDFSTFEKGWQDKALEVSKTFAEQFPIDRYPREYRSLYLWSTESWGVGKTHLASAICHRILDRWTGEGKKGCPRIIFLSEPELFRRIQATYSFSYEEKQLRESEDDIIRSIIYADLTIIDDIGKEKRKDMDFVQRTLFAIIDGRYKLQLPLVITANLDPSELSEHLGKATFDRIWEMVEGKSMRMDGRSFRRCQ